MNHFEDMTPTIQNKHGATSQGKKKAEKASPYQAADAKINVFGNYLASGSFVPIAKKSLPSSTVRNRLLFFGIFVVAVLFTVVWLLAGF